MAEFDGKQKKKLNEQHCTSCAGSLSLLTVSERIALLAQLNRPEIENVSGHCGDWLLLEDKGIHKLSRAFVIKPYNELMIFVNKVAELADSVNHHPLMTVEYGVVTVQWWSHNIQGLHQNDFIMAAKTSQLFTES